MKKLLIVGTLSIIVTIILFILSNVTNNELLIFPLILFMCFSYPFFFVLLGWGGIYLLNFFGEKLGKIEFRRELKKELKKIHLENPYIYFRDIPNKYGIGVSLVISQFKFGKKDVLAAILDLCAKGYICLKQNGKNYEVIDNKKDKSSLLKNEIYLLENILNKSFNLKEWINLCKEDAISLGLSKYYEDNIEDNLGSKNLYIKLYIIGCFISFVIFKVISFNNGKTIPIIKMIIGILCVGFLIALLLGFVYLIIILVKGSKLSTYNEKKKNILILTDTGKNEFHELCSLAKFLEDFGSFADKHVDEIVIWEQYLSYAIMFRLSKNIIKSGYEKLTINNCFIIDDLDKLVL